MEWALEDVDSPSQSVRGGGEINLCNRNAFAISMRVSTNDITVTGEELEGAVTRVVPAAAIDWVVVDSWFASEGNKGMLDLFSSFSWL